MTGDPLDRIEAAMTWAREKAIRRPPLSMEQADALVAVARAARALESRVVDGPDFNLGEIFNAAGRLRAALARLDGAR